MKKIFFLFILLSVFSCEVDGQVSSFSGAASKNNQNYSLEATEVIARYSNLPTAYKMAIARFVDRRVAKNRWKNTILVLQVPMNTEANSLLDMMGNFNATNNGATFTPGYGFTFDGVNDYINTGFTPSTGGGTLYTQNDGGIGVFLKKQNSPAATAALTGSLGSSTRRVNISQTGGTSINYRCNGANAITNLTDLYLKGGSFYTTTRTVSTTLVMNLNGGAFDSGGNTSNGLSDQPVYLGALNNVGTTTSFMACETGAFVVFRASLMNQADFWVDLVNLMIDLERAAGTSALPAWVQPCLGRVGQSNQVGTTSDTPSGALTSPITGVYIKAGTYDVLDYPTNNQGNNYGAELTSGRDLQAAYSRDIYMFKVAGAGTPVHLDGAVLDFNVASVGEFFDDTKAAAVNIRTFIHNLEKCPFLILHINHGEAEIGTDANAAAFLQNWKDFRNGLKAGSPVNAVVITRLNIDLLNYGSNATRLGIARNAVTTWQSEDYTVRYQNLDLYPINSADVPHYRGQYYEAMGVDEAILTSNFILPK